MVSPNDQLEDCIVWTVQENGNFTVKACYKTLNNGELALTIGHGSSLGQWRIYIDSHGERAPVLLIELHLFVLIFHLYCLVFKGVHPHIYLIFKVLMWTLIS